MFLNKCKTVARSIYSNINRYSSSYVAYDLANYRSLIKIKGQDASKYLQNLITNDIYKLNNTNTTTIYSMILNNRGRVLHDVLIYSNHKQPNEYLIEFDASVSSELIRFLNVYRLKKKVDLITQTNYKLFSIVKQQDNAHINQTKPNIVNDINYLCELDPRSDKLGFRCIIDSSKSIESNQIRVSTNLDKYKINLYKNGVAENHQDISYQNAIPLEYNLVLMNGVSFNKGCYLGQELIAKTHHTGVIRKRIMPIRLKVEDMNIEESKKMFKQDNSIINLKTGKQIGKLRNLIGIHGIAMLRINELDKNNLVLVDNFNANHLIDFSIPSYWNNDENLIKNLKENNII